MSSFVREGSARPAAAAAAAPRGGIRRPGPLGAARPGAHGPRPRARPLRGLHSPQPPPPPVRCSCGSGPRSPPPRLPERWPGRLGRQSPRGESTAPGRGARRGASMLPARAGAPRAPQPPARTVRAAGPRPLTFGAADLPTPSGGNESCHGVSPRAPSPARRARRRRGAGRAAALPLASVPSRSPPPLLFSILSSPSQRGGWGREASREDVCNFSSLFLFHPPPPVSLEKTMLKGVKNLGR